MAEKKFSDVEKLQMLLSHWLQHNKDHGKEYVKWSEVARQAGYDTAADCIARAVELLAKADRAFEKALESIGGPGRDHHHHHHD
jgi:hypothetical protein